MKKLLFIDRDGTLVFEPPITEQIDTFEQIEFLPRVIQNLSFIRHTLDYDFIIVSNQDGLGTKDYPRKRFERINKLIFSIFHTEGVDFDEFYFDEHTPEDFHPNRKPGTGC
jgi:imidazoleglycerol-phosphate dehydratase/histidinol-phosphatase